MKTAFKLILSLSVLILFGSFSLSRDQGSSISNDPVPISPQTEECIMCHASLHPGIVADWKSSLHASISPADALKKDELHRRISNDLLPDSLKEYVTGCYECHSLNTGDHADAFEHNGYIINLVVSSADCAVCHNTEKKEYENNLMSHAYGNLMNNDIYQDLMKSINGNYTYHNDNFSVSEADDETNAESCLYCHGTKLEVTGKTLRETEFGALEFPEIKGWPNNGVGRINTDGSLGSCSSCHPRHAFSIETARKPYTCAECHKGPDVPAYKIYEVSKHGNIFSSESSSFNFNNVPWTVGEDFSVPTCATCHASELADSEGNIIAERSHQFNDRLAWRLFGVPYAHPHPIHADLNQVKNSAGLPLITELDGTPVKDLVIDKTEQDNRNKAMKNICSSCHGTSWVEGHFDRLDHSIQRTNQNTITATQLMSDIWESGSADGDNMFDESIERNWTSIWLFYANSVRMASAMSGGGDYGVFADGRYQLTNSLMKLIQYSQNHDNKKKKKN